MSKPVKNLAPGYCFNDYEIATVDFETFWSVGYSLTQIPTSVYVRDERFAIHGVGINYRGATKWYPRDEAAAALHAIPWEKTALLCHNTAFDGFILYHHFGIVPKLFLDTMSMSRANWGVGAGHRLEDLGQRLGLGGKMPEVLESTKNLRDLSPEHSAQLGTYCCRDVDLTFACFRKLIEGEYFPNKELLVIDLTLRMFCDPILRVDRKLLEEEIAAEQENKAALVALAGVPVSDLMSNEKLAQLLRDRDVEPPMKISPTTGLVTYAFSKADDEFTELVNDPAVGAIVEARLVVKSTISETRAAAILKRGDPGPLPILLRYFGARTGRWSGGDGVNFQNLPGGRGSQSLRLRHAMLAPPGYRMVRIDSSQIEARAAMWFADDTEMLDVFRKSDLGTGVDPYLYTASQLYGKEMTDKKKYHKERQLGKVISLALQFRMGWKKFQATAASPAYRVQLTDEEAQRAVAFYRSSRPKIVQLWEFCDEMLYHMWTAAPTGADAKVLKTLRFEREKMWMSNDCCVWYPGLHGMETDRGWSFTYQGRKKRIHAHGGVVVENFVQGECRNIVAEQALRIAERYKIVLLAHDEIVFLAPEAEADDALAWGMQVMRTPPTWAPDLPLNVEGKYSHAYGK